MGWDNLSYPNLEDEITKLSHLRLRGPKNMKSSRSLKVFVKASFRALWLSCGLVRVLGLSCACLEPSWVSPELELPGAVLGLSWAAQGLSSGCLWPVLGLS